MASTSPPAPAPTIEDRSRARARRGLGAVVTVALVVLQLVAIGSPRAVGADPAGASACGASAMYFSAHEDDSILFESPTLLGDIRSERCVQTVFLTAGDAGNDEGYWGSRELGAQAAYARMAGVADVWSASTVTVAGHAIRLVTLEANPKVTLVFLRLPDGNVDGSGFALFDHESLVKLWDGDIARMHAVDGSTSYDRDDLTTTLAALINAFAPQFIGTQDYLAGPGDGDHTDHVTMGHFTEAAHERYNQPHDFVGFKDYITDSFPQNVSGANLAAKQAAFYAYGAHDGATCSDAASCAGTAYDAWLAREYVSGSDPIGVTAHAGYTQSVFAGVTVTLDGSRSAAQSHQPLGYAWTQTGGPTVTITGADTVAPTFVAPAAPAVLTFSLTVGDGTTTSAPSQVTVDVTDDRDPTPSASAGADQTVASGAVVTLDGTASSDPHGRPLAYTWTQTSGAVANLSSHTTAAPIFTAPTGPATLHFSLVVTNGAQTSTASTVTVTVQTPRAGETNAARVATPTASSQSTGTGQLAASAIDGVVSGYPVNQYAEWATLGEGAGAWLKLSWSDSYLLDHVVLYDRPNPNEQITSGTLSFSDGTSVDFGALPNDAATGLQVEFAPRRTTSVTVTVTGVRAGTGNIGLAEMEAWGVPAAVNVASSATVTASSQSTGTGQLATSAVDGVISGYPAPDYDHEWASAGEAVGAWLELTWASPTLLDHVVLYDRPNLDDQVTAGTLTFSDGSIVAFGALPNDMSRGLEVDFTPRLTTSLRMTVTGTSPTTHGIGLAELQAFGQAPVAPAITSGDATSFTTGAAGSFTVTATGTPTPRLTERGALPAGVSFVDNGDGTATLVGTPGAASVGDHPVSITADNGVDPAATQQFTLTVISSNRAPVAAADGYVTDEDTARSIAAPGVLANDTDPDDDVLQAGVLAGPAHGQLTLGSDGSFVYAPDADWHGVDGFTYVASDGHISVPAAVTITVAPVNDAPTLTDPGDQSSLVGASVHLAVAGADRDGDALAFSATGLPSGLTIDADGTITGAPTGSTGSPFDVTVSADDGHGATATAHFRWSVIDVAHAPVGVGDAYGTVEDVPLTVGAPGVLGNDTDADHDALHASLLAGPSHGTLDLAADGGFTYTPAAGFAGSDAFTYRAGDATLESADTTVTLLVSWTNHAPAGVADAYTTAEDTVLHPLAGVLGNDTDADHDVLHAVLEGGAAHGVVILAADGSFTYAPSADWSGTDSFTYRAADQALTSAPVTVTITVIALDDAPVAAPDAYTTVTRTRLDVGAPGVLGNDRDVDGPALSAVLVKRPAHGSLTLAASGGFSYTPGTGYVGTDTFTYQASDGAAKSPVTTVTIAVTWVAAAPYWPGHDVARGVMLRDDGPGGYTVDAWGGVHAWGGAPTMAGGHYTAGRSWVGGAALLGTGTAGVLVDTSGRFAWGFARPGTAIPKVDTRCSATAIPTRGLAFDPAGAGVTALRQGIQLDAWGGLHRLCGAAPINTSGAPYWRGWDIARGVALLPGGTGGFVVDAFGGIHAFGHGRVLSSSGYWLGWDIARGIAIDGHGHGVVLDGWGGSHPFTYTTR